jgi:predicted Rossmann-fold nucleotide-binding protein
MEAANLGAYLSGHDDDVLDAALGVLAGCPSYSPSIGAWAEAAFEVRHRWPGGVASLGVPTWFYGHEPPNAFAEAIAKYFKNAIREDVLLHVCRSGIVFLPGRGGTVQEVFQAACENYYAVEHVTPMVLVGQDFWTGDLPVWPLLRSLATGRSMEDRVHLVESWPQAVALLVGAH